MDLNTYLAQLRDNLTTAATLGDDKVQAAAQGLGAATEQANRLVLFNALSDLAAEISTALDGQDITVSLAEGDVKISVRDTTTPPPPDEHPTFEDLTGDISRVTLRLVDQIKEKAEEAASQSGVSLNSWVSQAVKSALRDNWNGYTGSAYKSWPGGDWQRGPRHTAPRKPSADGAATPAGDQAPGDTPAGPLRKDTDAD